MPAGIKMGKNTPRDPRGRTGSGKVRMYIYLDAPVPKEKPPLVPVPPAATVVEPSVPVPKENPVDMIAPGQAPKASGKGSGTLHSPQSRGGPGSITPAQPRPGGNLKLQRPRREGRSGRNHHAEARSSARRAHVAHRERGRRAGDPGMGVGSVFHAKPSGTGRC